MRSRFMAALVGSALIASLVACGTATPPAPPAAAPKLLVVLVVDQMRFDYIARMDARWTRGFRRLLDEGALFTEARYPYLNTVTCAGHSTIGTGTFPSTHGVFLNEWWNREAGRRIACTDDGVAEPVSYASLPEPTGHGAGLQRVPTLADRLRERSPGSRVVTLSMKARSAVMLAGHGGTAVTWFGDNNNWATSTQYTETLVSEVKEFVDAHPVTADHDAVWDRVAPAADYTGADEGVGERPKAGWTSRFPHPLAGAPGTPDAQYMTLWRRSPFSDAYLGRMAADLVERFGLGRGDSPDLLGVSFSALDYVGHDFGPESLEVQDTLLRLDETLGALLDALDRQVGRGNYVVALSADHGVARVPEARAGDTGRVPPGAIAAAVNDALAGLGPAPHVADVDYTNVYFTTRTRTALASAPDALERAKAAIGALPGVARVLDAAGLETKRDSPDPVVRAAALSYVPGRSGDLIVVPREGWILSTSDATTHGSLYEYDQHVPVLLSGPGLAPGRYAAPASPADIAPTLGAMVGITLPGADGHVLTTGTP